MKESHIYEIHVENVFSELLSELCQTESDQVSCLSFLLFQSSELKLWDWIKTEAKYLKCYYLIILSHHSYFYLPSCSFLPYIYDPVMNSESSVFYSHLVSFNYETAQSSLRGALRSVTRWLCDGWFFLAVLLFQFRRPSENTADRCCLTSQQKGGNEPWDETFQINST